MSADTRPTVLLRLVVAAALLLLHSADADLYVLGLFPIDPAGKGGEFGDMLGRAERAEHFRVGTAPDTKPVFIHVRRF
jgi:hypothetical protein